MGGGGVYLMTFVIICLDNHSFVYRVEKDKAQLKAELDDSRASLDHLTKDKVKILGLANVNCCRSQLTQAWACVSTNIHLQFDICVHCLIHWPQLQKEISGRINFFLRDPSHSTCIPCFHPIYRLEREKAELVTGYHESQVPIEHFARLQVLIFGVDPHGHTSWSFHADATVLTFHWSILIYTSV